MALIPSANQRGIEIIEEIKRLGFPNRKNLKKLEALFQKLQEFSPLLKPVNRTSIQDIGKVMKKITSTLEVEKEISVNLYTIFFAKLVILEMNLYGSS